MDGTARIGGDDGSEGGAAAGVAPVKKTPLRGMPRTVAIILEPNDSMPPTGQFIGHNGKGYMIRPGEVVNVPHGVLGILDDAVVSKPNVDPATGKTCGWRDQKRYTYQRV